MIRRFVIGAATLGLALAAAIGTAHAQSSAVADLPAIDAGYSGWSFAVTPTQQRPTHCNEYALTCPEPAPIETASSVMGWKWSAAGWSKVSFQPGTTFHVAPYGSGWSWAWREGAWYAIRQQSLSPWSCSAASGAPVKVVARSSGSLLMNGPGAVTGAIAYRFNSAASERLGTLTAGDTYYPICSNQFMDAGGVYRFATGGCRGCGGYMLDSYTLAWIRHNGAWTKAYLKIELYGPNLVPARAT